MGAKDIIETQQSTQNALLMEALMEMRQELFEASDRAERLEESLSGLDLMSENIGWTEIGAYGDDGPSLSQLKRRAKQIRNGLALSPHLKQGGMLRSERVWSDEPTYSGVPGLNGTPTGRGVADAGRRVNDPLNQHHVFGNRARTEREAALYTDGHYFLIGDDSTRQLRPMSLSSITADYRNPEDGAEIWAYRRTWTDYSGDQSNPIDRSEWIFTDLFKSNEVSTIQYVGKRETVNRTKTIIDGAVNTQSGWAYGFPDAGAVVEYARMYSEFVKSGKRMSDAMARIWASVKTQSAAGSNAAAAKIAGMDGFGNTQTGVGADLVPLSSAGRSYDFDSGISLLAIVAAGIGVSVVALSANPGAAGGSYGAAQVLTLPERLSTQARRNWHSEYDVRVLKYLGAKDPKVTWRPLVDGSELLRLTQSAQTAWNSGLYEPKDGRALFDAAFNDRVGGNVPDGILIPNNSYSEERTDIDPNGAAYSGPDANRARNGTGQGQSTGIGDNPGASGDLRSDTIS